MSPVALLKPQRLHTNRTRLRQEQSSVLRKARGRTVIVVTARNDEDEKCVLDRSYFEEILGKLQAALETLEITADPKLFSQLLRAGESIDKEVRRGTLHSFEEAFGDA